MKNQNLWIDLADIELEDIQVLSQEGGRGIPEFAASTASSGSCCAILACSCSAEDPHGVA